jgi:GntR family transcriptional repressor for pyruvate dehydrogenase complex
MTDTSAGSTFKASRVARPREQVEGQIRGAILGGQFSQGEKLPPETDLAHMFGVSRPTVREALQSLATSGLIQKIPGASGGSFVRAVNHESFAKMLHETMSTILQLGALDFEEVHGMRKLLDVPAAQLAAENGTDEQLKLLRQVITYQSAITLDDPDIPILDATFHSAIGEASGNRLLAALVSALHRVSQPVRFLKLSGEVGQKTIRQHKAILRAIESRQPKAAGVAMEKHLDYVFLSSAIAEVGDDNGGGAV